MIPITKSTSPEPYIRKPKTPPEEENPLLHRKNSFNSFLSHASFHHSRSFLFLSVLFFQILIFLAVRSFPVSVSHHSAANTIAATTETTAAANIAAAPVTSSVGPSRQDNQCSYGKIFVYDLPSSFNREIIDNCDKLNPWGSKCDALSNDGFGREATGISRVVPENLAPAWYWTDQFVSEIIFHNRILNHKCRTLEADNATAFYVPFYVGLAVDKYLWTNSSAEERDQHCEMVLSWLNDQPYFKKSNGWDHFMTMGRITWDFRRSKDHDWGSSCIYKPGMRNITRLLIERNPWDYFDVGVPYPSGFHPRSDSDIIKWQEFVRTRNRSTLFCFAGATRGAIQNDFRSLLLSQCYKESGSCKVVDCAGSKCSNGSSAILETFLDSDFCLQPRGDSFTRRSIFDCMVAGSIPVLFWKRSAYYQYEWFLPSDSRSFSVFIDRNEVKNGTSIREVLESFSKEEVRKMREKVIEYIPKFVYARPHQGLETIKDAFDVAIDGVLNRVKEQENWYKW